MCVCWLCSAANCPSDRVQLFLGIGNGKVGLSLLLAGSNPTETFGNWKSSGFLLAHVKWVRGSLSSSFQTGVHNTAPMFGTEWQLSWRLNYPSAPRDGPCTSSWSHVSETMSRNCSLSLLLPDRAWGSRAVTLIPFTDGSLLWSFKKKDSCFTAITLWAYSTLEPAKRNILEWVHSPPL